MSRVFLRGMESLGYDRLFHDARASRYAGQRRQLLVQTHVSLLHTLVVGGDLFSRGCALRLGNSEGMLHLPDGHQ